MKVLFPIFSYVSCPVFECLGAGYSFYVIFFMDIVFIPRWKVFSKQFLFFKMDKVSRFSEQNSLFLALPGVPQLVQQPGEELHCI